MDYMYNKIVWGIFAFIPGFLCEISSPASCYYKNRRGISIYVRDCPDVNNSSNETYCCGSLSSQYCCDYNTYHRTDSVIETAGHSPMYESELFNPWIITSCVAGIVVVASIACCIDRQRKHGSVLSSPALHCRNRMPQVLYSVPQKPPDYDTKSHAPPAYCEVVVISDPSPGIPSCLESALTTQPAYNSSVNDDNNDSPPPYTAAPY